ncbi:unnamed protein product [Boreogadus saida]
MEVCQIGAFMADSVVLLRNPPCDQRGRVHPCPCPSTSRCPRDNRGPEPQLPSTSPPARSFVRQVPGQIGHTRWTDGTLLGKRHDVAAETAAAQRQWKGVHFKNRGRTLVKTLSSGSIGSVCRSMRWLYFGSSLCGVDLNRDGLSDLLVGAPMHSHVRDEGQVTVYLSRGNGVMEEAGVLKGDNAYNAHFGESIAAIGDIDDDGYQDVAIGAPKEEEFAGAVYIYHGDGEGIITKYSMRLSGRTISPGLQMFGQSISGGVDMDGNGYADVTIGAFMADSVVLLRTRPVISVDVFIFLPVSINITVPQCHEGPQNLNCFNLSACLQFRGRQVPGQIELLYNLTADADKRQRGQPSRIYFSQNGVPVSVLSQQLNLDINREVCQHFTAYVKKDVKDVFTAISFEVAYSLGKHVLEGASGGHLPALAPVLRWKKGGKIAAKNETYFEKNCLSDDCAADLRLSGQLLLSGLHSKPHLALGGVRNISLNLTVSNTGDDAYDTNIYFNFSREVFYINFWQKEEKGISCELVELDFLKCSVGFPFMRAQTKYHLAVIFDTSRVSGENDTLRFLAQAKSANPEHKLEDNTLDLSLPLIHEVDTTLTGVVSPSSFVYGSSVDASRFVQLEDMECNFQPLNLTFQRGMSSQRVGPLVPFDPPQSAGFPVAASSASEAVLPRGVQRSGQMAFWRVFTLLEINYT